ncbi:MAG: hypothetical protein L3K19_01215 [Thermoplasmata archaeon]|nr:hypothetical protein [Thermoplasmata archaeon]
MELPADSDAPNYREVRLRDLRPMEGALMVVGRVVRAERRDLVRRSDGGSRPVLSGLLTDGTATVRFTWWDPPNEEVEVGTLLRAVNIQIREFRGRSELTFNSRTRVLPAEESELPVVPDEEVPLSDVSDLAPGQDSFRLEARVLAVRSKSVEVRGEAKTLFEGTLADSSGKIPFTAWSDFHLDPGSAYRIRGAVVRSFRDQPQVTLDERCTVEPLPEGHLPSADELAVVPTLTLADLEGRLGTAGVSVAGWALGVLPPSGLVHRCPECRRTLSLGVCRTHGNVSGYPDLRARVVLDDGTGTATVELGRSLTEALLARTLDECIGAASAQLPALEDMLSSSTFGRRFLVEGRAVHNEFGVTIFADRWAPAAPVPNASIVGFRRALEGGSP